MSRQKDRATLERMVMGKDLPVSSEEWVALRHAVGWPAKGNYVQIIQEYLFTSAPGGMDGWWDFYLW